MSFLNWFNQKIIEIKDDISVVPIDTNISRVVEFGSGDGIATICLAKLIPNTKVMGLDKNPAEIIRAKKIDEKIRNDISISSSTDFIEGDIVTGKNIPSEVDLAFCNKLLIPILESEFGNVVSGEDGIFLALENLTSSLSDGGWLVVIEKSLPHYGKEDKVFSLLEQLSCIKKVDIVCLRRNDLFSNGLRDKFTTPYVRYVYRKIVQ